MPHIQAIDDPTLICKYGYFFNHRWHRCKRPATYYILIDDHKFPVCTRHKNLWLKRSAPLRQLQLPFPRS